MRIGNIRNINYNPSLLFCQRILALMEVSEEKQNTESIHHLHGWADGWMNEWMLDGWLIGG